MILKPDTARTILLPQLVDETDGVTPVTAMTVGDVTARLIKEHTMSTITMVTAAPTGDQRILAHVGVGFWSLALLVGDTDTIGSLRVELHDIDGFVGVGLDLWVPPLPIYWQQMGFVPAVPGQLHVTTLTTVTDQTTIVLADGSADNGAYDECTCVFIDQTTMTQIGRCTGKVYTGSTKGLTLHTAPQFTIATGDYVQILVPDQAVCGEIPQVGQVVLAIDAPVARKMQQVTERNINGVLEDTVGGVTTLHHRNFANSDFDTEQLVGRNPNVSVDIQDTTAAP